MSGISRGLKKGHVVTKLDAPLRQNRRKGTLGARPKLIRSVIREVAGWAPYEKRIMEILKGGGTNPTKRAQRFAKNRLGSHTRAKRKCSELNAVILEANRLAAAKQAAAAKAKKEAAAKKEAEAKKTQAK